MPAYPTAIPTEARVEITDILSSYLLCLGMSDLGYSIVVVAE